MIERILRFLYEMRYPSILDAKGLEKFHNAERPKEDLIVDAQLYTLADKYGISTLKHQIQQSFKALLENHWRSDKFAEAARIIYTTTPDVDRGLRDLIKRTTWSYQNFFAASQEVQACVLENPGYSKDLVSAMFADSNRLGKSDIMCFCQTCGANTNTTYRCADHTKTSQITVPK